MTLWRSQSTVEELNSGRAGTLLETLGIEFSEIGDDFIRGTMPVDGRTRQPYGLLHGGADARQLLGRVLERKLVGGLFERFVFQRKLVGRQLLERKLVERVFQRFVFQRELVERVFQRFVFQRELVGRLFERKLLG